MASTPMIWKIQILERHRVKAIALLYVISTALLVFLYRQGSARVDRGTEPGMRDLGTYLKAGSNFIQSADPYSDPAMRLGPSLLPFFGLIDLAIPHTLLAITFQIMCVLGPLFLVQQISQISPWINPSLYFAIMWLSSIRENLVNIQITGLLAILVSLGILIRRKNLGLVGNFIGLFLIAISVDTKPHLLGLFALVYFLIDKRISDFVKILGIICVNHAILSLLNGHYLTLSWAKTILGLYDSKSRGELGESLVLWPLIERFGINSQVTTLLATVVFVLLVLFTLRKAIHSRRDMLINLVLSLSVPSFGVFFHYYDLSLAISLFFAFLYLKKKILWMVILLPIYLIPSGVSEPRNLAFALTIFLIFLMLDDILQVSLVQHIFLTAIVFSLYATTLKFVPTEIRQHFQVTFASVSMLMTCFLFQFKNSKSIVPRNMK